MEVQDLTKRIKPESSLSLARREERRQYLHGCGKKHISYFNLAKALNINDYTSEITIVILNY